MHAHDLDRVPTLPSCDGLPTQGTATVVARAHRHELEQDHEGGGLWWLRCEDGEGQELRFVALRAASCMLEPADADRVWFAREGDEAYVLSVLIRADSDQPARLATPGDLELDAGGELRLSGRAGVALSSPAELDVHARTLQLSASEASLSFATLRASAKQVFATLTRVTRVGQILELLVDTVTQRSRNNYRAIAEVDHVQAKLINQEASAEVHVNAKRALINGEDIIKMDGGQIHLG